MKSRSRYRRSIMKHVGLKSEGCGSNLCITSSTICDRTISLSVRNSKRSNKDIGVCYVLWSGEEKCVCVGIWYPSPLGRQVGNDMLPLLVLEIVRMKALASSRTHLNNLFCFNKKKNIKE